ncbi:MAG: alkaline phosphatase family protein [Planctomycetota bacterium]
MSNPTAVILVVGLNKSLIGDWSPNLQRFCAEGQTKRLKPVLPAVTCSVQSSMLTGRDVSDHGIVGNGWFDRELNEVHFWKQSNRLIRGEKVWETARKRESEFTCLNMFWWYNMYSSADYSVTPRPCSGGTICIPAPITRSLQDRCTRRTAARYPIVTAIRMG